MFEDSHFVSLNACNTHPLIHTIWLVHSKAGYQSLKISTLTQYMKHIWSIISRVSAECSRSKPPDMEDDTMVVFGGPANFLWIICYIPVHQGDNQLLQALLLHRLLEFTSLSNTPYIVSDEQKISHINLCCQSI